MVKVAKGALVEYAVAVPPLALLFDFNPETITRTRSVTISTGNAPGTRGGYAFRTPAETSRVAQGVSMEPESLSLEILLDASDRLDAGDAQAETLGVQPEIDVLRAMVEPKPQGPGGLLTLANLGLGGERAFQKSESPSVLLFVWGTHILPVFLKSVEVKEVAHFPLLVPYRANVTLGLQIIESDNPFYNAERLRQAAGAALQSARTAGAALKGLLSGVA